MVITFIYCFLWGLPDAFELLLIRKSGVRFSCFHDFVLQIYFWNLWEASGRWGLAATVTKHHRLTEFRVSWRCVPVVFTLFRRRFEVHIALASYCLKLLCIAHLGRRCVERVTLLDLVALHVICYLVHVCFLLLFDR